MPFLSRPFSGPARRSQTWRHTFERDEPWPEERQPELASRPASIPDGEVPNDPRLRAFMLKRHGSMAGGVMHGEAASWGRRFVAVDDPRGRLQYSRRQTGLFSSPSLALALQDITHVRALPAFGDCGHCLEVACPPHRLVLRVEEGEQRCQEWVQHLERRVSHWKKQARLTGPPTAVPNFRVQGCEARGQPVRGAAWLQRVDSGNSSSSSTSSSARFAASVW
jgi:hypothetical protein